MDRINRGLKASVLFRSSWERELGRQLQRRENEVLITLLETVLLVVQSLLIKTTGSVETGVLPAFTPNPYTRLMWSVYAWTCKHTRMHAFPLMLTPELSLVKHIPVAPLDHSISPGFTSAASQLT